MRENFVNYHLFFFLFVLFSFTPCTKNVFCERKTLELVNRNKKSVQGNIQNKIKKYEEHKLILITNINSLEKTYKDFLDLLNEGKNQIRQIIYLENKNEKRNEQEQVQEQGREKERERVHISSEDADTKKERIIERPFFLDKTNIHFYDGVFIILDVLDDKIVEKLKNIFFHLLIKEKKNIFFSINSVKGKNAISFLNRLNIHVHGNDSYVYDMFGATSLKQKEERVSTIPNAFYTNEIIKDTPITNISKENAGILFRGTSHSILLKEQYFLAAVKCTNTCLLYERKKAKHKKRNVNKASGTNSYRSSSNVYEDEGHIIRNTKMGKELLLVSAIQYENNSRFIFSSSSEIVSNTFFHINEVNKTFAFDIIQWVLHKKGIIRYNNFKLYKKNSLEENAPFFINEEVYMSIDLFELQNNYWMPYKTNDIQFEVHKINIQSRYFFCTYTNNTQDPTYFKKWKLPLTHGIYKIRIYYLKRGYAILHLEHFVTVQSNLHFDNMKKIPIKDYPFYLYMYISLIVFFFFVLIFIFDDSQYRKKKNK